MALYLKENLRRYKKYCIISFIYTLPYFGARFYDCCRKYYNCYIDSKQIIALFHQFSITDAWYRRKVSTYLILYKRNHSKNYENNTFCYEQYRLIRKTFTDTSTSNNNNIFFELGDVRNYINLSWLGVYQKFGFSRFANPVEVRCECVEGKSANMFSLHI